MANVVTTEDVRWQLRVDDDAEHTQLDRLVSAAQGYVERYTGLVLTQREVTETLEGAWPFRLKAWPIVPDTEILIDYTDAAGAAQTLFTARLASARRPATLLPAFGAVWPWLGTSANVVTATFHAGYASAGEVPADLKQAIMLLAGHFYQNRGDAEAPVPSSVAATLRSYRFRTV